MFRKVTFALLALALLLPGSLAQDEKPTVAILRFGPMINFDAIQELIMQSLQVHGFLSEAEAAAGLSGDRDLEGERLRITLGDANLSFANVNFIVDAALDKGADALVTFSTPVTLAALKATQELEDPPLVLFGSVYNPYEAGVAQTSCVKPAHVTGLESVTLYADIVPLLLLQNPDIKTIGAVYSASETSGRLGAEEIVEVATALGLTVEQAAVTSVADLAPAAEGLVAKGVEAFLIPSDLLTVVGLPTLMQVGIDNGLPVFHSTGNSVFDGATVSAGVSETGVQGKMLGALLAGALRGDLDASRTGIGSLSRITVAVSADTAAMQDVALSDALLERADLIVQDGIPVGRRILEALLRFGLEPAVAEQIAVQIGYMVALGRELDLDLPPEVEEVLMRALADQAVQDDIAAALNDLHCTDEIIAEQQAELDAMEG